MPADRRGRLRMDVLSHLLTFDASGFAAAVRGPRGGGGGGSAALDFDTILPGPYHRLQVRPRMTICIP